MLVVEDLSKQFGDGETGHQALAGVNVQVRAGELFTLLGPSGCGKTTCLRAVAGLEIPDSGEISIGGTTVYSSARRVNVPVQRRPIGMVFQSYAVWPHMTVSQNVAFPLRAARVRGAVKQERLEEALHMVGLDHLADRPATDLSGGQQQRVAFARAVVREADLLLLDEPLSNLDAKLRVQMRVELRELMHRLGRTAVFVTHDQEEALTMSDRIAVLCDGQIVEVGTPQQLYQRPQKEFTAQFIGQSNFFKGRLDTSCRQPFIATDLVTLNFDEAPAGIARDVVVLIRPEHVRIEPFTASSRVDNNTARGKVMLKTFSGRFSEYEVDVSGHRILVQADSLHDVQIGDEVLVGFPAQHCVVLEPSLEEAGVTTDQGTKNE